MKQSSKNILLYGVDYKWKVINVISVDSFLQLFLEYLLGEPQVEVWLERLYHLIMEASRGGHRLVVIK